MKTLLLLRHAKSSWDDAGLQDFDRPLNRRGMKTAPLMGRFMGERKLSPDLVLSSPAKRAAQTAQLVVETAGLGCELRYDERIYAASVPTLQEVLADVRAGEVLLVGHNPGLEELLEHLTGESEEMPTAALARIVLSAELGGFRERSARLDWLVRPKELGKK